MKFGRSNREVCEISLQRKSATFLEIRKLALVCIIPDQIIFLFFRQTRLSEIVPCCLPHLTWFTKFWLIMNISNRSCDPAWWQGCTSGVTNAPACFFSVLVLPCSVSNFDLAPSPPDVRFIVSHQTTHNLIWLSPSHKENCTRLQNIEQKIRLAPVASFAKQGNIENDLAKTESTKCLDQSTNTTPDSTEKKSIQSLGF